MRKSLTLIANLVALLVCAWQVGAAPADEDQEQRAKTERRIQASREIASAISCSLQGKDKPLPLVPGPLSAPEDYVADYTNVTTWAWGKPGRPQALLCLSNHREQRVYELVSLCAEPLTAELGTGQRWRPSAGWAPKRFDTAPQPAESERLRLAQMKALARRFTGHEFGPDTQRYELRLVGQPIYRYPGPSASEVDGALFLLSLDLNPEVLLVIELTKGDAGKTYWQYFLQRLTVRNVFVSLDGRPAWEAPEVGLFSSETTDPFCVQFHDQAPEASGTVD